LLVAEDGATLAVVLGLVINGYLECSQWKFARTQPVKT
jgi:hypothetical protein